MKISVLKEHLIHAVVIAERLVGKKESLPVLSCILFDIDKDCTLYATNLEAGIEVKIQGEVGEKGKVAVSASIMSQTLRSLSGDKVTLETDGDNLVMSSRGSRTLLKAVPYDEFPSLVGAEGKTTLSINRTQLISAVAAVTYAASPSMIRPELGSVYISMKDGLLTTVATDSFRLAEKTISGAGVGDVDILIPLKHAAELSHVLEKMQDEKVELAADDSQLVLSGVGIRFVSRIIDGTFPNYKEIIPKSFATEATLLKGDLVEVLRKARVFSDKEQHIGLHLYPKRKEFLATAQSPAVGEMSDSIEAAVSGEDIDINFHIGYLADCLGTIQSDSVTLYFAGLGKPLILKGVADATFKYLVMPLNR